MFTFNQSKVYIKSVFDFSITKKSRFPLFIARYFKLEVNNLVLITRFNRLV